MKTNKELKEEILDILNTIEVSYDCGIVLYSISKEEFSQVFKNKVEILLESSKPATNKLITILELIKPLKKDLCTIEEYNRKLTDGEYTPNTEIVVLTKLVSSFGFSQETLSEYRKVTKPCWKTSYWLLIAGTLVVFTVIAAFINLSILKLVAASVVIVFMEIISIVTIRSIFRSNVVHDILTNL